MELITHSTRPPPPAHADRILVVDDEPMNLRLIGGVLQREGFTQVSLVSESKQALSTFLSYTPDLVLLDLHMPAPDGFVVLQQLRQAQPPGVYLPILVLTGDTTPEAKRRALSSGATDILGKPFDAVELTLRIRNLLETSRLYRELRLHNRQLEEKVGERTVQLEAALQRAEAAREAKELFLGKMSHELRTPLNAATGALELLRHCSPEILSGEGGRMVAMASRNMDHMVGLINEILYLQSVEQGTIGLDRYPVHLGPLLESAVERAAGRLRTSGLTIRLEVPDGLAPIVADGLRLADVVWRLLDNAIRFTPEGEIVVRVVADREEGTAIRIEVSDPGVGIAADRLDAIFQPFEQADNSSRRRYEGAGIGLSLCRALCTLMEYRLTAESEPGRGSTFSILLTHG